MGQGSSAQCCLFWNPSGGYQLAFHLVLDASWERSSASCSHFVIFAWGKCTGGRARGSHYCSLPVPCMEPLLRRTAGPPGHAMGTRLGSWSPPKRRKGLLMRDVLSERQRYWPLTSICLEDVRMGHFLLFFSPWLFPASLNK